MYVTNKTIVMSMMVDRLGQSIKCPFLAAVVNESMPYLYIFFAIILSIIIIVSKKGITKK